jgi:hypothetical protein
LRGESSLTGWLHKATLLNAKQWWRGELRRRQREQTAVELNTTMKDDNSLLKSLAGVLDEGLLELRKTERQALLLRFFERRSHREIGATLGIGEDAARKRVDKALAQLTAFFQKRGYAVGSVAGTASALNAAALTAPAGLAAQAAQAALAEGSAASLSWLAKLFHPSKAHTAVLCTALLLGPPAWQAARWRSATEEQRRLAALMSALQLQRDVLAQDQAQIQRQLRRASNSLAQLQVLSGYTASLTEANLDPRLFRWEEFAQYVRVPKAVLRWVTFDTGDIEEKTLNYHGARVSPTLLGALGLSAEEQARVQQFCQTQMDAYHAFAESRSYLTNLPSPGPAFSFVTLTPDSRAWVTPALSPEESSLWRQGFEQGLTNLIGAERTEIILRNANDDYTLSAYFQQFGAEDFVVAVTPSLEGGCKISTQDHFHDGKSRWYGSRSIPLSSAMTLSVPEPPDPFQSPRAFELWHTLGRRPLPAALVDYVRQWTAAHPEVPDQPATP